jgi:hypothetical protein
MRAGKNKIARNNSNTASTVMPISLNGNNTSHTNGYSSKANSASGQHKIKTTIQIKKLNIRFPSLYQLLMQSDVSPDCNAAYSFPIVESDQWHILWYQLSNGLTKHRRLKIR